jgi:hypothetical protein
MTKLQLYFSYGQNHDLKEINLESTDKFPTQNLDGQTDRWMRFLYTPSLCLWEYNNR